MCASSGSRIRAEAENALVKQKSETFDQEAGSRLCRAWQVRTLKVVAWNILQKGHSNICRQKARLRFVSFQLVEGPEICRWDKGEGDSVSAVGRQGGDFTSGGSRPSSRWACRLQDSSALVADLRVCACQSPLM